MRINNQNKFSRLNHSYPVGCERKKDDWILGEHTKTALSFAYYERFYHWFGDGSVTNGTRINR